MRTVTLLGVLSMTAFMIFWYNVLISECKGSNFFSNYIKNIQKGFVHDIFKQFLISYSESLSFSKGDAFVEFLGASVVVEIPNVTMSQ